MKSFQTHRNVKCMMYILFFFLHFIHICYLILITYGEEVVKIHETYVPDTEGMP